MTNKKSPTPNVPQRRQVLQAVALLATAAALPTTTSAQSGGGAWIMVTHKVESYEKWKPVFDSTAAMKRGYGWKQSMIMAIDGDNKNLLVMEEFASMEKAKAFATSPELKAAMGKAGVTSAPEVKFVNAQAMAKA